MFKLSDRVCHKQTGNVGIVIGYGHRMVNNVYLTTLKVQITNSTSRKEIIEALASDWLPRTSVSVVACV